MHKTKECILFCAFLSITASCTHQLEQNNNNDTDAGLIATPSDAGEILDAAHPENDAGIDTDPTNTDAGIDAGTDTEIDAGVNNDAGTEIDAGIDAGIDVGIDAGNAVDAGEPIQPDVLTPQPPMRAVFSHRNEDDSQSLMIENELIALINRATTGSQIRIAMFSFTRNPVTDALIRAHDRGVDVKLVLDGDAAVGVGVEAPRLQEHLGAARVKLCDAPGSSCIGSGIMHNKIFLFSNVAATDVADAALSGGVRFAAAQKVVVQASHNLTNTQLHLHNNAVIVAGDTALYNEYIKTWNDLFADVENANYYRIVDGDLATRAYFFPRTDGDTVVSVLNNITCDATSKVRVAMAFFTDARIAIADALAARKREGCKVEVVAGDDEIPLGTDVARTLTNAGVTLVRYPARGGEWSVHSKYLLVDAPYALDDNAGAGPHPHRRLVFTGSHNWTGPALNKNDETMLRIEDDGIFSAFVSDWQHIKTEATRP